MNTNILGVNRIRVISKLLSFRFNNIFSTKNIAFRGILIVFLLVLVNGCNQAKERTAVVETNKGTFKFILFEEKAPITTKNFIELTEKGFYNGLKFHRYEPGFVIQGGDPKGDGTGGSDKTIKLEVNPSLTHEEGVVAMARSMDPDSASSQFYVTLAPAHNLDNSYAVFGKVTDGMSVVKQLRVGDKMLKVTIISPQTEK